MSSLISEQLVRSTLVVDLINHRVEGAIVNEVHAKQGTVTIRVLVDDEAAWQRVLTAVRDFLTPAIVLVPAYRKKD